MQDADFYKKILDNLYDGVYFCDFSRKITYWNRAAEKMTGYKAEEITGTHCWDNVLTHVDENGENMCKHEDCPAMKAMRDKQMVEKEIYLKHKEGYRIPIVTRVSPILTEDGKVEGAVEIFSDNSAKLAAFQKIEKLEELAFIDQLTGVGNRRYSEIKIGAKLEEIRRYAWAHDFGVLFLDIDHFKIFNDNYGHEVGDAVLKMVAKTMFANIREEDFVGRWGGEEFVLTISAVGNKELYGIAEKIRKLVASSNFQHNGETLHVTISVGATLAKRGEEIETVVKRADALMYEAKEGGRNNVVIG